MFPRPVNLIAVVSLVIETANLTAYRDTMVICLGSYHDMALILQQSCDADSLVWFSLHSACESTTLICIKTNELRISRYLHKVTYASKS